MKKLKEDIRNIVYKSNTIVNFIEGEYKRYASVYFIQNCTF